MLGRRKEVGMQSKTRTHISENGGKYSREFETPIARSARSPPKTLMFFKKTIDFNVHTEVNLKDQFCEFVKILTRI